MKFNWNYPTTVWVGENRVNDLSDACKNLNIIKPLFVTDKDLVNLPFIKNIISENLKKFDNLIFFQIFQVIPLVKMLMKV
jgi:alcohol dehydrogenase class IV